MSDQKSKAKKTVKLNIDVGPKEKHWDDTFRLMSWWEPDKVNKAKVMVVGAGALGNEVLKNLALMNVGNIVIVDFDTIEYSNLCRSVLFRKEDASGGKQKAEIAKKRIQEINPNINVQTIQGDIGIDVGYGIFKRMDVVIGCLDNRLARLYINRHCYKVGTSWIDGAIENLAGQLNVYTPGKSCYECQLSETEWANIRFKMGCPDIARRNSSQGKIPTTPISSSIIGAMQVQEAIKIIHDNEQQSLAGTVFQYEGMNNMILQYDAADLAEECESHFAIEDIKQAKELNCENTIAELFSWLDKHFGEEEYFVHLDHEVVLEITTLKTENSHKVVMAKSHLSDDIIKRYEEIPGEEVAITESITTLDSEFKQRDLKLKDLGIPPLHILTVEAKGDIHFIELTGDENFLNFK